LPRSPEERRLTLVTTPPRENTASPTNEPSGVTTPTTPTRRTVLKGAALAAAAAAGSSGLSVLRPFDVEAAAAPRP
jgi:hypothetical protein